mgnify:CR=1 FL=1
MKRVLNLFLCLTIMTTAFISASASELTSSQLSELNEYGIFQGDENGDLNLDSNITRAEFCKVILSSLGYSKNDLRKFDDIKDFYDVESTHWAYLYINNAKKLSLIDGYENGLFMPEQNISLNEAVKIVVSALGYEPTAKDLGGYPSGYTAVANNLKLTQNIERSAEEPALRGDVASIIFAALNVPIMQRFEFGDREEYKIMDGTGDEPLITLSSRLKNDQNDFDVDKGTENVSEVPRFNGPEYTGRILKISELKKKDNIYSFKNSLDDKDNSTYIINENTYVYVSKNTVELSEIKTDMYAQCWYYTNASGDIELLKIELMREKPAGV